MLTTAFGCSGKTAVSDGGTGGKTDGGTGTGGRAGADGGTPTGGTAGGVVGTGGRGGTAGGGGAGTGGTAGVGATGGRIGTGGTPTGGAGGGGGVGGCEVQICTAGAKRCSGTKPTAIAQTCTTPAGGGCNIWSDTDRCGPRESCNATTFACACDNDAACMGKTGDFCPTANASTFSICTADGDGCFFVSGTGQTCTAPQVCDKTGVVATGSACGCPPVATTPHGAGVILQGKGCATEGMRIPSEGDEMVLVCSRVPTGSTAPAGCLVWTQLTNCHAVDLTAGVDPTNNLPNCICKGPRPKGVAETDANFSGAAGVIYVDPDPPQATMMTGQSTGAKFPAACRLRQLHAPMQLPPGALNKAGANIAMFDKVVAISENHDQVHFNQETIPVVIPDGVTLTTTDSDVVVGQSVNPKHFIIDLTGQGFQTEAPPSPTLQDLQRGARVRMGNNTHFNGFTLMGAASAPFGVVGGWQNPTNPRSYIPSEGANRVGVGEATDLLGCGGTAVADISFLYIVGTGRTGGNTGIAVNGSCHMTANQVDIFEVAYGIEVDHTETASTNAQFDGTFVRVQFPDGSAAPAAGAGIVGMAVTDASSTGNLTDSVIRMGSIPAGIGVHVGGDAAEVTGEPIPSGGKSTLLRTAISLLDQTTAAGDNVTDGAYGVLVNPPLVAPNAATLTTTVVSVTDSSITLVGSNGSDATLNDFPEPVTLASEDDDTFFSNNPPAGETPDPEANAFRAADFIATGFWGGAGTDTLTNTIVTVGAKTHGVAASGGAKLTINQGTITNSCVAATTGCGARGTTVSGTLTGSTSGHAVYVPKGNTNPTAIPPAIGALNNQTMVIINGPAMITKFERGIDLNEGYLTMAGAVQVTGNTDDGIRLWGRYPLPNASAVSINGTDVHNNGGEGFDVRSRTPITLTGFLSRLNAGSGVDVHESQNTGQSGYQIKMSGAFQVTGNGRRGIVLSGTLGKVGARMESTGTDHPAISANHLEGLRVSEASPNAADFTEVLVEGADIFDNLSDFATARAGIIAGGVFFAKAATDPDGSPTGLTPTNLPTRVSMGVSTFLANHVYRNGRHEIGFDIFQQNQMTPAVLPGDCAVALGCTPGSSQEAPWDLSTDLAGVAEGTICGTSSKTNTVTCYDTTPGADLGVAIPEGVQIPVKIKAMHWQVQNPGQGRDFTAGPLGIPNQTSCTSASCMPEPAVGVFLSCAPVGCMNGMPDAFPPR